MSEYQDPEFIGGHVEAAYDTIPCCPVLSVCTQGRDNIRSSLYFSISIHLSGFLESRGSQVKAGTEKVEGDVKMVNISERGDK